MNTNLLNIINRIVAEQGEGILSEPRRITAFFADLAKDEQKSQKNAFIKCLEHGFAQALKNVAEPDRDACKQRLAQRLNDEEGLDLRLCGEALELLAAVLFANEKKKVYCKKCGKELQEEWKTCPFCLSPMAANTNHITSSTISEEQERQEKKHIEERIRTMPSSGGTQTRKNSKAVIIIVAAIVLVLGFVVIQLRQASNIAMNLSRQKTMYLARQYAQYWGGKIDGYIKVLQSLSNIMEFYENLEPAARRQEYENTMRAVFEDSPDFVQMFTVWKPNAIDGMDPRFVGRTGSTATGQFAFALGRETGKTVANVVSLSFTEIFDLINGPNIRKVEMSDPAPFKNMGKDTFVVRITVPIINKRTNEVVGVVGCQLDIAMIQPLLKQTIKENEEVAAMSIYSNKGFILGSYQSERIGKKMTDEAQYGNRMSEAFDAVKSGKEFSCLSYDPALKTNLEIVVTPITIENSGATWSIMIGSTEEYIKRRNR